MAPPNLSTVNPGNATRLSWANLVSQWISFLFGLSQGVPTTILNGGFQQYTGLITNVPDNWVFTPYTGGAGAIDTTTQPEGLNSFKITVPGGSGNGGGYIESYVSGTGGALVPCNPNEDFWASWWYQSSVATVTNLVQVRWFNAAGAFISASTLWSGSSGQPSTWTQNVGVIRAAAIPSNARYYSLRFTGGSVGSVAGNVWYGQIRAGFQPQLRGISQTFLSSGTFTPPPDCFFVTAKLWGGGGGGNTNGGGGGGGYCEGYIVTIPGVAMTVTIGNGGSSGNSGQATTFATMTANGGSPGNPSASNGGGGTAGGGYLNITGQTATQGGQGTGGSSSHGGFGGIGSTLPKIAPTVPGGGGYGNGSGAAGMAVIIF